MRIRNLFFIFVILNLDFFNIRIWDFTITYRDGTAIRFALAEYDMLLRRFKVVLVVLVCIGISTEIGDFSTQVAATIVNFQIIFN
jgi:hypothetical protein